MLIAREMLQVNDNLGHRGNAVAAGADSSGEGLRTIQSGKVQNYGQLLFGAAAVLA